MASTTFQNGVTLTDEDWFNDVDFLVYDIFGDAGTTASAAARLTPSIRTLDNATGIAITGTLSVSAGAVFAAIQVGGVASLTSVAGAAVATQAIMEAATATNSIVSPGRAHFHPGSLKAWVRFDGSATSVTAASSYNVSCISDGGAGIYEVKFINAFSASAGYAPQVTTDHLGFSRVRSVSAESVTIVLVGTIGTTAMDASVVSFVAPGDFA